jgi:hypothetical protein
MVDKIFKCVAAVALVLAGIGFLIGGIKTISAEEYKDALRNQSMTTRTETQPPHPHATRLSQINTEIARLTRQDADLRAMMTAVSGFVTLQPTVTASHGNTGYAGGWYTTAGKEPRTGSSPAWTGSTQAQLDTHEANVKAREHRMLVQLDNGEFAWITITIAVVYQFTNATEEINNSVTATGEPVFTIGGVTGGVSPAFRGLTDGTNATRPLMAFTAGAAGVWTGDATTGSLTTASTAAVLDKQSTWVTEELAIIADRLAALEAERAFLQPLVAVV